MQADTVKEQQFRNILEINQALKQLEEFQSHPLM
jgi:hypothetical protein